MNRYTNVVLTVIAVALSVLAIENGIAAAHAAPAISRVAICDPTDSTVCVSVGQINRESGTNLYRLLVQAP
jgi:hypothetical protein